MYKARSLFRSLPQSYVLIDRDFKIIDATNALLKKMKLKRTDLKKRDMQGYKDVFEPVFASGKPQSHLTPMFNDNGQVEYLIYEMPTCHDESDIRNKFISVASHELKTPLTALKLQVQMAKRMAENNSDASLSSLKVKKMIERTHLDILRLSRLVDDMLEVSEFQPLNRGWFNLEELLEEFFLEAGSQFNSLFHLVSINVKAPVMVYWDKERIEKVLMNLLSNAFRYGRGTPILIEVSSGGGYAYLKVTDKGQGISLENQQRIFKKFERDNTHRNSGLGLGLYTSLRTVEAHGGKMDVTSELDQGATFEAQMPLLT